ncbi:AbrB/MazE/SpoVT family DNA-binding domain-containing protein [Anaerostipes faecalis]|uniref:AbrB/MazE/SpoVT family DNA-binding domain-containing protein n=1 Tax=Anaerostipes faecalis TaxID=2738446 RepID=UPI003F004558
MIRGLPVTMKRFAGHKENSQGIRIPKEVLQEVNAKINDVLDVQVADVGKVINWV